MRFLFIHAFPLIRLLTVWGYAIEKPFHARDHSNAVGWICNMGFFQTQPTDPKLSTCKRCSALNASQCTQDSTFSSCTPFSDAFCKKCERALPTGWEYSPGFNDCKTKECSQGYYYDYSSLLNETCLPCPAGSYCSGKGLREECGRGLTTLFPKESNPLGCIPTTYDTVQEIQIHISFSLLAIINQPFCATKNSLVSQWLQYGRLIDCAVKKGDSSAHLVCFILISRRFTEKYLAWLYKEIQQQTPWMKSFLLLCIQQSEATISAWNIRVSDSLPGDSFAMYTNDSSVHESTQSGVRGNRSSQQTLSKSGPAWGTHAEDVAIFSLASGILASAMFLSSALLMVGIILRFRKRKELEAILEYQTMTIKSRL